MLPKSRRLSAREVREVLKKGRSVRLPTVSARYVPAPVGKAAIVVSAKVARKAVERNVLRRAGYQALPSPLPPARLVVFINKKSFAANEISALCSKLS